MYEVLILYWDCFINNGVDIDNPKVKENINRLFIEGPRAVDFEKLQGSKSLYSIRVNDAARLIFTECKIRGKNCLILLEYLPNHKYNRSKFLKQPILNEQFIREFKQQETFLQFEEAATPSARASPNYEYLSKKATFTQSKFIILNQQQEEIATQYTGGIYIIDGVAGSGKTSVALALIQNAVNTMPESTIKKIIYVVKNKRLAELAKSTCEPIIKISNEQWLEKENERLKKIKRDLEEELENLKNRESNLSKEEQLSGEKEKLKSGSAVLMDRLEQLIIDEERLQKGEGQWEVEYTTFEDFITKQCPEKKIVGRKDFYKWLENKYPILNKEVYYNEICIIGGFKENKKEYLDVGAMRSLLPEAERGEAYNVYIEYTTSLKNRGEVDPALFVCDLQGKFGLVVVDESQDFYPCEIEAMFHASFNCYPGTHDLVLCGDVNQSLKPNSILIESHLHSLRGNEGINKVHLKKTYRCSKKVAELATRALIAKSCIFQGVVSKGLGAEVSCAREIEEGSVMFYRKNKDSLEDLIELCNNGAVLVVVDVYEQIDLAQKTFGEKAIILTADEAKGLEWYTIIYFNPLGFVDRVTADAINNIDWADFKVNKNQPKDKTDITRNAHLLHFNRLFVLTTRAIRDLYIVVGDNFSGLFSFLENGRVEKQGKEIEIKSIHKPIESYEKLSRQLQEAAVSADSDNKEALENAAKKAQEISREQRRLEEEKKKQEEDSLRQTQGKSKKVGNVCQCVDPKHLRLISSMTRGSHDKRQVIDEIFSNDDIECLLFRRHFEQTPPLFVSEKLTVDFFEKLQIKVDEGKVNIEAFFFDCGSFLFLCFSNEGIDFLVKNGKKFIPHINSVCLSSQWKVEACQGFTPLFLLCANFKGMEFIQDNAKELIPKISPDNLCFARTGNAVTFPGVSPIYLMTTTEVGIKFLQANIHKLFPSNDSKIILLKNLNEMILFLTNKSEQDKRKGHIERTNLSWLSEFLMDNLFIPLVLDGSFRKELRLKEVIDFIGAPQNKKYQISLRSKQFKDLLHSKRLDAKFCEAIIKNLFSAEDVLEILFNEYEPLVNFLYNLNLEEKLKNYILNELRIKLEQDRKMCDFAKRNFFEIFKACGVEEHMSKTEIGAQESTSIDQESLCLEHVGFANDIVKDISIKSTDKIFKIHDISYLINVLFKVVIGGNTVFYVYFSADKQTRDYFLNKLTQKLKSLQKTEKKEFAKALFYIPKKMDLEFPENSAFYFFFFHCDNKYLESLLQIFDENPELYELVTKEFLYESPHRAYKSKIENSLFFSLGVLAEGILFLNKLFKIRPDLLNLITPEMLYTLQEIKLTNIIHTNVSAFSLLCQCGPGLEILKSIFHLKPTFLNLITTETLSSLTRQCMEEPTCSIEDDENISAFSFLCGYDEGITFLMENSNLLIFVTEESLYSLIHESIISTTDDDSKNISAFHVLCTSELGIDLLKKIVEVKPQLFNALTDEILDRKIPRVKATARKLLQKNKAKEILAFVEQKSDTQNGKQRCHYTQ